MNNRWTPERLAECRALYEGGMPNADLGAQFGIQAATIGVMAWQKKWRRNKPVRQATEKTESPTSQDVMTAKKEVAFNERLAGIIAEYWRKRGKEIAVSVHPREDGAVGIRSRSVNGVPNG